MNVQGNNILKRFLEFRGEDFDDTGSCQTEEKEVDLRERLWYAILYLYFQKSNLTERADLIIQKSAFSRCHFSLVASVLIIAKYENLLSEKSVEILKDYIRQALLEDLPDFEGVNDNYPIMAAAGLLLGGQILDDSKSYSSGCELLLDLRRLLFRRGTLSEYNSPSYAAISLHALSEAVNHIQSKKIRRDLLDCESRIWYDVLAHYHPPTGGVAGPHSRAYMVDCLQHDTGISFPLYSVLGDSLKNNPLQSIYSSINGAEGAGIHHSVRFMQLHGAYLMSAEYHPPRDIMQLCINKTFPFECSFSTEVASFPEPFPVPGLETVYPGGVSFLKTYMTEDYALGTANKELASGVSSTCFHILYKRNNDVKKRGDVRTVFSKYITNDKIPGEPNKDQRGRIVGTQLLDEGRKIAFQDKGNAFVLYRLKPHCAHKASSLKLSIVIPCHYNLPDKIWLDEERFNFSASEDGVLAEALDPCKVIVKDGSVYMRFTPLCVTDLGRNAAVKIEKRGAFLLISFYNYEGSERDFPLEEINRTQNGFIAEIRSSNDDFEHYQFNMWPEFSVEDRFKGINRRVTISREELDFKCVWCHETESIQFATMNDKNIRIIKMSLAGKYPRHPLSGRPG